jgi:S-formylglutathione hydrolase
MMQGKADYSYVVTFVFSVVLVSAMVSGFSETASGQASARNGTIQRIKAHGKALEGNLQGESADRDVTVYLPPGYESNRNRRYSVLYLLHGYLLTDQYWTGTGVGNFVPGVSLPAAMDKALAAGKARELIIIMPNAYTSHGGSMYSNSVITGDWEGYITQDLVSYIDRHYCTIPDRMSRGIAGHSMGGYGAIRIAMKHPEVFSSLYNLSACCLMNNPAAAPSGARGDAGRGAGNRGDANRGAVATANVLFAQAAAWSPNPKNPPQYFDLPIKDGQPQPTVAAKWIANSPLAMLDQYVMNLKKYKAIASDVGLQDGLNGVEQGACAGPDGVWNHAYL